MNTTIYKNRKQIEKEYNVVLDTFMTIIKKLIFIFIIVHIAIGILNGVEVITSTPFFTHIINVIELQANLFTSEGSKTTIAQPQPLSGVKLAVTGGFLIATFVWFKYH